MKNQQRRWIQAAITLLGLAAASAQAQLQITELMANSADSEPKWEWAEIYNAGSAAVDLNGYVLHTSTGNNPLVEANISNANGNTVIAAGTAAVLYNGSALEFDPTRFRNAWTIPSTVPLIGVSPVAALTNNNTFDPSDPEANPSRSLALWPTFTNYNTDFATVGADSIPGTLDDYVGAVAAIQYTSDLGFPSTGVGGVSLAWNGTGSYTDGNQWALTDPANIGTNGVITSVLANLPVSSVNVNDIQDTGNPGTGSAAAIAAPGLSITEIMYNPRSPDADWEWVEVRNNTGAAVNLANYVLHDGDGTSLSDANIASGMIDDGSFAVFYDSSLDALAEGIQEAWDPGGTKGINFIPVNNWPALGNSSGDDIGLWPNKAAYDADVAVGNDVADWAGTSAKIEFLTDDTVFPDDNGSSSIHLTGNTTVFSSGWELSDASDGISFNPTQLTIVTSLEDHSGGDTGSPGTFGAGTPGTLNCDADSDGDCEQDDINAMFAAFGSGGQFDYDGSGTVDADDIGGWLAEASLSTNTANPDAKTFVAGDANLDGSVDSTDLGFLLNNFNSTTKLNWIDGNLNGDGVVNSADLGQLLNNFNFTSAASAGAVPEPGSLAMMLLAGLGFAGRWRRANAT